MTVVAECAREDAAVCWICGELANSGEHKVKRSDLRAIFGVATQKKPLFVHNALGTNYRVGSFDSDSLKLLKKLCRRCNDTRTQLHDRAWERFSEVVRNRHPPVSPGSKIRADRIWLSNSQEQMRNVQLYFAKLFGCLIVEGSIPIDLSSFSTAILTNKSHPDVFLQFGWMDRKETLVGTSDVSALFEDPGRKCVYAGWTYELCNFVIAVNYAPVAVVRRELLTKRAWHPSLGTGRFTVIDMS